MFYLFLKVFNCFYLRKLRHFFFQFRTGQGLECRCRSQSSDVHIDHPCGPWVDRVVPRSSGSLPRQANIVYSTIVAQEYIYMHTYTLQCINLIIFLIVQFHRNNIDIRSPLQPIKIIKEGLVLFAWGNGDAVWQIRRRFQQVRSLHQALSVLVCHAPAVACCGMVADIVLPGMGLFGFMNYCWYHDIVELCAPKDQKHQALEKDENGLWEFTLHSYDDWWTH